VVKTNRAKAPEIASLGHNLHQARLRRGLTQTELARLGGISTSDISKIELQQRLPTLTQLVQLARTLALPLQWFLSGKNRPGSELRDLVIELRELGLVDLLVTDVRVPGAFRPTEQVLALTVCGDRPDPRLLESLPALLAWNDWQVRLLKAYARSEDRRALHRLAWLADIVLTIHKGKGFPGGCPGARRLAALANNSSPPVAPDSLGFSESKSRLPPVSRRWNVTYPADLNVFRARAEHLQALLDGEKRTHRVRGRLSNAL
jgi:transcriptional regulator with XRE-family HTH domain